MGSDRSQRVNVHQNCLQVPIFVFRIRIRIVRWSRLFVVVVCYRFLPLLSLGILVVVRLNNRKHVHAVPFVVLRVGRVEPKRTRHGNVVHVDGLPVIVQIGSSINVGVGVNTDIHDAIGEFVFGQAQNARARVPCRSAPIHRVAQDDAVGGRGGSLRIRCLLTEPGRSTKALRVDLDRVDGFPQIPWIRCRGRLGPEYDETVAVVGCGAVVVIVVVPKNCKDHRLVALAFLDQIFDSRQKHPRGCLLLFVFFSCYWVENTVGAVENQCFHLVDVADHPAARRGSASASIRTRTRTRTGTWHDDGVLVIVPPATTARW
mmetsp:Transcript_23857/g.52195  ORF Transcript_23857/g.52195 Transcript_23857/m.52195 type:complete len:317 (+) Transcript_23857:1710-2660(+)